MRIFPLEKFPILNWDFFLKIFYWSTVALIAASHCAERRILNPYLTLPSPALISLCPGLQLHLPASLVQPMRFLLCCLFHLFFRSAERIPIRPFISALPSVQNTFLSERWCHLLSEALLDCLSFRSYAVTLTLFHFNDLNSTYYYLTIFLSIILFPAPVGVLK